VRFVARAGEQQVALFVGGIAVEWADANFLPDCSGRYLSHVGHPTPGCVIRLAG
jgi:hypothetical protein